MTYLLPHFSSLFPIYVFLSFLIHSQRSNTSLHKYVLLSMTLGCLLLYLFFFIYEKFENTFFFLTVTLQFSSHDHSAAFRYVRFINDSEPRADDVIESRLGFGRMLTHRTATLMSSVTPFVCGAPLYLWQALHFLSPAGRVFAARWFQGFRALCPYSTPLFDMVDRKSRGGGAMQTGRRREGD